MRYSTLIRRLVIASIEARHGKYDVADRLADRCLPETNIIRRTLMNAVCDPRFKLHVDQVHGWRQMAIEGLENLASLLMTVNNLSDIEADDMLNHFLNEWLMGFLDQEKGQASGTLELDRLSKPKIEEEEQECPPIHYEEDEDVDPKEEMMKAIKAFDPYGYTDEEEQKINALPIGPKIDQQQKSPFGTQNQEQLDDSEPNDEELNRNQSPESQNESESMDSPWHKTGKGEHQKESKVELENHFLSHIPPSLVKLAKMIGRSDESETEPYGHFPSASKCDIAGITTGNDLSSVLPSELALLADPQTDNLFYKNYVTKKLQVFSSVSRGQRGKKHKDGPIIICLDTSSSMSGDPVLVAKALTIAVCIIAQIKHRKVLVVKYSMGHEMYALWNLAAQRKDFLRFLSIAASGGNDEESLFRWLLEDVIPNEGDYKTADILCVSDFGWGEICEDTFNKIKAEKERGLRIYGLNIGHSAFYGKTSHVMYNICYAFTSPADVCDSLWTYCNGVCKEDKRAQS